MPESSTDHSLLLKKFPEKKFLYLLCGLWAVVQVVIYWQKGIVTDYEAEKYISQAHLVLQYGVPESRNYYLYFTEISLIVFCLKFHLSFAFIVVIQMLVNFFATFMFLKLSLKFLYDQKLALLCTAFFILNFQYQQYNTFLFTESIFYSMAVICTSYFLRLSAYKPRQIIALVFLLALLCITRPTGILFVAATIIYHSVYFLKSFTFLKRLFIIAAASMVFLFLFNIILGIGGTLDFMLPFRNENIICGVDTTAGSGIQTMENGNSIGGLLYYIFHNPIHFLRLAWLRSVAFFGMLRSYFSLLHNVYLAVFFYPIFIFAVAGIWKRYKAKDRLSGFLVLIISLFWITTMLTCDDWHNRFILTISPFMILLAFAAFTKSEGV